MVEVINGMYDVLTTVVDKLVVERVSLVVLDTRDMPLKPISIRKNVILSCKSADKDENSVE